MPHSLIAFFLFYRRLTGSKTPLQDLEKSKKAKWGTTARKGPIRSSNYQREMKESPLIEDSLYQKEGTLRVKQLIFH
ncbi:hypothetical protein BLL40_04195 [Domibacillus mangrovi]|uniref:Uncharacterized protein n=1 Tax=Domibacillus mangrovi TaxID=1714354 RepID=A0A1Q5P5Y4_9BACI|nr:hypothetical protein BLL40_04195 [Domibacillus mangrovi]